MGACREITISYDYTFPGGTVNLTGESVYTHYYYTMVHLEKECPKTFTLHHDPYKQRAPTLPAEHVLCSVQL